MGKTFSLEINGKIPGQITFKDNGILDIKNNVYNHKGSAKYEIIEEDGEDYVVISDRPAHVEDFLGSTAVTEKDIPKHYWRFNKEKMKLESLAYRKSERNVVTYFDDKKPKLSSLKEINKEDSM